MKRQILRKKLFSGGLATPVIMVAAIVLLFGGCGLPDQVGNPPEAPRQEDVSYTSGTSNAVERYLEFTPSGSDYTVGTKVFYRIYASESTLNSDITTIKTAIQSEIDSKVSQTSYNRIVSMGYKELKTSSNANYLTRSSEKIRIRLFDEGFSSNNGTWTAGVFTGVGDNVSEDTPSANKPLRSGLASLENKGFSFFYGDTAGIEANPAPVSADTDTSYSGYTDGKKWYVNAYVVSVGQDVSLALSYSRIAELGFIIISESGI